MEAFLSDEVFEGKMTVFWAGDLISNFFSTSGTVKMRCLSKSIDTDELHFNNNDFYMLLIYQTITKQANFMK